MLVSGKFAGQVAVAYEHLYDIVYLRTHPLAQILVIDDALDRKRKAWRLHQILLDAIEELDPGPDAPAFSREWRRYRLMVLRYVDGLDPQNVADRLSVSRRTFYREHKEAIEAVAAVLEDRVISCQRESREASRVGEKELGLSRFELLRLEGARVARARRYAPLAQVIQNATRLVTGVAHEKGVRIEANLSNVAGKLAVERNIVRQIILTVMSYLLASTDTEQIAIRVGPKDDGALVSVLAPEGRAGAQPGRESDAELSTLEELGRLQGIQVDPILHEAVITGFGISIPREPPRTVLVVDDNEDSLQLVWRYLSSSAYRVVTARSGAEALRLARSVQPHAIMLDMMMPGQDGWDVLQKLTNQPETEHIPVIVCTVLGVKELALSLGATAFLEKPITEIAIVTALKRLDEER
jgi:CheY-like chemotaxis protein